MNKKWKWVFGLTLALIVFIVPSFAWGFLSSYGMMRFTQGWYMPMMNGAPWMMALGTMFLMWLILLTSLILIGMAIVWLVSQLSTPKRS